MPEHTNKVAEFLKRLRKDNEAAKLPQYVWPGGYTIVYYCASGEELCAECATKILDEEEDDPPVAFDTYDEGPRIYCAGCNKHLDSSYGDPEAT